MADTLIRLRAAQVPCAPVLAVDGVVADPHVAARGVLQTAMDPTIGEVLQTRMPIGDGTPPRPAPILGAHGEEILDELGFDTAAIEAFIAAGAILSPAR
jgi:crotonobetainyl-CoA:carnitine CoA-transferase CaiB-like acyl-CoA transferase